ncbi:hypothetical protein P4283_29610 [Bacillus thuringiensis]|nr:hypothetical protein [Bacillus thuringiensis]
MKKINWLLSGISLIGALTLGITQFSQIDQLATHGHYPTPTYSVDNYDSAPQQG